MQSTSLPLTPSKDVRSQRPFKLQQLSQSTPRKAYPRLCLVESIETRFHGAFQTVHIALRVEVLPRSCTDFTATALQRQKQSVQSLLQAFGIPVVDLCVLYVVEIVELVGIDLMSGCQLPVMILRTTCEQTRLTVMSYSSCSFVHHTAYIKLYPSPMTRTVL